jgi:cytochrome P450
MAGTLTRVPYGPGFQTDPHPTLAALRATEPVARIPHPFVDQPAWLVLRYATVRQVVTDSRFGKPVDEGEPPSLNSDPPEHTRLRRLAQQAFSQRRVADMAKPIRTIARDLLAPLAERGSGDLVAEYAKPLPILVIAEMLGVPRSDFTEIVRRTEGFVEGESLEGFQRAYPLTEEYVTDLIAQRRRRPGPDLTTAVLDARVDGQGFAEDEAVRMLMTLLVNGFVSSIRLLANTLHAVLGDPTLPKSALPSTIEETMRHETVVSAVTWRPSVDLTLDGVPIAAGDLVIASFQSANRDPERFPDPDRFDRTRHPNPHLGFSHGLHRCLGAALARLETVAALEELLDRLPRIVPDGPVQWESNRVVRGVATLPARWHSTRRER